MEKDIFEYDKLNIYAKKEKAEEIIEHYKIFNWTLESENENKKYEDLSDLTFTRPHKIKNKDDLQLLQIYMEETLNTLAKLEKFKHARSQAFGMFFGGLTIVFLAVSIWFFASFADITTYFIFAITLFSVAVIFAVLMIIFIPKILKKENKNYKFHHERLNNELNIICEKAKLLAGGNYEN